MKDIPLRNQKDFHFYITLQQSLIISFSTTARVIIVKVKTDSTGKEKENKRQKQRMEKEKTNEEQNRAKSIKPIDTLD